MTHVSEKDLGEVERVARALAISPVGRKILAMIAELIELRVLSFKLEDQRRVLLQTASDRRERTELAFERLSEATSHDRAAHHAVCCEYDALMNDCRPLAELKVNTSAAAEGISRAAEAVREFGVRVSYIDVDEFDDLNASIDLSELDAMVEKTAQSVGHVMSAFEGLIPERHVRVTFPFVWWNPKTWFHRGFQFQADVEGEASTDADGFAHYAATVKPKGPMRRLTTWDVLRELAARIRGRIGSMMKGGDDGQA